MTKELQDKFAELYDRIEAIEEAVYDGPDDDDDCCACGEDNRAWKETDPFVDRLHHLSTSQLEHLMEEAEWILEERHRQEQTGMCPECQAQAEAEDEDGYDGCCHCNCDCHDLPDDDDEDVTEEVQKVVDDMRGKNRLREIDTTDGLFSQFAAYVVKHPELRFYQALTNWSGCKKILGEDDGEDQYDLFHETTKGPSK